MMTTSSAEHCYEVQQSKCSCFSCCARSTLTTKPRWLRAALRKQVAGVRPPWTTPSRCRWATPRLASQALLTSATSLGLPSGVSSQPASMACCTPTHHCHHHYQDAVLDKDEYKDADADASVSQYSLLSEVAVVNNDNVYVEVAQQKH